MTASQVKTEKESVTTTADTEPLESAVVFEGESSKKCGHVHKWVPLMDYLESCGSKKTLCPTCQTPIVLVCDGSVAAATTSNGDTDKSAEQAKRVVTFKYRNHLYKLALQRVSNSGGVPFPLSYYIWMWRSMLQLMGEDTSVTVQERVSQALRMDMEGHMKVIQSLQKSVVWLRSDLNGDTHSSLFSQESSLVRFASDSAQRKNYLSGSPAFAACYF